MATAMAPDGNRGPLIMGKMSSALTPPPSQPQAAPRKGGGFTECRGDGEGTWVAFALHPEYVSDVVRAETNALAAAGRHKDGRVLHGVPWRWQCHLGGTHTAS